MKVLRNIIEIDEELCDGCGQCVPSCAEGALEIIDGKAKVVADLYCDGLGACLGECPTGALEVVEREADEFDEAAVEERLKVTEVETPKTEIQPNMACGCPSTQIQQFEPCPCSSEEAPVEESKTSVSSALTHWPVQIRLVPPTAPFLKDADLLVLADCVPVAYPTLHQNYLKGRVVMMGCPKFDDAQAYVDKFAEIFKHSGVKSITTLIMEVPCCAGLPMIVKQGLANSGADIPLNEVVVSRHGKVIE
jgi:Pyruvate/2-oxoacid:ferredoxin oxidoreductase delta subunit